MKPRGRYLHANVIRQSRILSLITPGSQPIGGLAAYGEHMNQITPKELAALGENVHLIDVREADEHAEFRVPYAKNIPLSEFAERVDEVPDGAYIMCLAGGRSAKACEFLDRLGRQATNVTGGITAWEDEGGALVYGSVAHASEGEIS